MTGGVYDTLRKTKSKSLRPGRLVRVLSGLNRFVLGSDPENEDGISGRYLVSMVVRCIGRGNSCGI